MIGRQGAEQINIIEQRVSAPINTEFCLPPGEDADPGARRHGATADAVITRNWGSTRPAPINIAHRAPFDAAFAGGVDRA